MQLHITPSMFVVIIVRSEALGYNSYFFQNLASVKVRLYEFGSRNTFYPSASDV